MRWYLINLRWLFLATFWFLQTGYAQNISDNFYAQRSKQLFPDSLFSTYYYQRVSHFKSLPQTTGDIIFIGNSISDGGEWQELFDDLRIKNRGISGDVSAGVIHRIDEIIERKPAKIFLMIGTNDLARGISTDSLVNNILWIAKYLQIQSPATKLFIQSILPVNETFEKFGNHTNKSNLIAEVNSRLRNQAVANHYTYVDLHTTLSNKQGKLDASYTNDGLHLTGNGYLVWKHLIFPYVYDAQQKPALIPLPKEVQWREDYFWLNKCKSVLITDKNLHKEAVLLQDILKEKGWPVEIKNNVSANESHIELSIKMVKVPLFENEAYRLEVTQSKISITANSANGIFNGIQTLRQLMRDNQMVDGCTITDWPSFSWRGYMIDVGRNYMSVPRLKQQIEVMAKYKLNVFHFHATEDIAWRIESKMYPQLTAPEHMLRNKGMYYSESEIKDLIAYCKERYITFVPEIDMPGHSAAFRRAMKTDMQSDSGVVYVKNILKEFCTTYDVPYVHIGADEVKISNKQFVPDVTSLIESYGKKVIGWQPGGNFSASTIRQLWMDDNAHRSNGSTIQYIDSRHLYLNHMDPLEAVVTIYNRELADKTQGDATALGATICMWHDRAVAQEEDVLNMNPVYPGMLTFAERSWRGGGQTGWVANISDGDEKGFIEFENRLLENKQLYFKGTSFPYVRQANITWKLYGPYENNKLANAKFDPEKPGWNESKAKPYATVIGGTIVMRHWWEPLIKGAVIDPKENTTWYATTTIWSDEDGEKDFWIGFNNLSRSPATDSPPAGAWNNLGGTLWVNGKEIAPPVWLRGGQRGNSEIPLMDEGYEYRVPTKINLKKGWNTIQVKVPITTFKGRDWQNPVKWMFTVVPRL